MRISDLRLNDIKVQNIINYENGDSAFKEAVDCYEKYDLKNHTYKTDYSSIQEAASYYEKIQYCVQRFTQALENYFKAIAISTGKKWRDNRHFGHHLFNLYNEIMPKDLKYIVDERFLYSDKYADEVLGLKRLFVYYVEVKGPYQSVMLMFLEKNLKDLSEDYTVGRPNANVITRFPGEKYIEYNLDFLYDFTRIINIITFAFRDKSSILDIDVHKDPDTFIKEELDKVFTKIDFKILNYDQEFIDFVIERLSSVYNRKEETPVRIRKRY